MLKQHLGKKLEVLAIDSEYLIGMDIERILSDALACSVTVLTPKLFNDMAPHKHFDVAVLEGGDTLNDFSAMVDRARRAASHLVFSISDREHLSGVPGFEGVPVVLKPFDGDMLVNAVTSCSG